MSEEKKLEVGQIRAWDTKGKNRTVDGLEFKVTDVDSLNMKGDYLDKRDRRTWCIAPVEWTLENSTLVVTAPAPISDVDVMAAAKAVTRKLAGTDDFLEVTVSKKDIASGCPTLAASCPVALATNRAFAARFRRWAKPLTAVYETIVLYAVPPGGKDQFQVFNMTTPPEVFKWIETYDATSKGESIKFRLQLSPAFLKQLRG